MWWYYVVVAIGLYIIWNNNPKLREWVEKKYEKAKKEYESIVEYSGDEKIKNAFLALTAAVTASGADNKWTVEEIVACLALLNELKKAIREYNKNKDRQ